MTFNYNFLAPPLLDAEVLEDFEEKKKVWKALVRKSFICITSEVINPTFDIIMDHRFKQKKKLFNVTTVDICYAGVLEGWAKFQVKN